MGAGVIESDALSRDEINSNEVKAILREWWGDGVFGPKNDIDREKVASRVFADPGERRRLEELLHPRVARRRAETVAELQKQPRIRMIVVDSPLLYEAGVDVECDAVIFVDADEEVRRQRSEKLRDWPKGEIARREKQQMSLDTKMAKADYMVDSNSSLADLRGQVNRVFSQIMTEFNG